MVEEEKESKDEDEDNLGDQASTRKTVVKGDVEDDRVPLPEEDIPEEEEYFEPPAPDDVPQTSHDGKPSLEDEMDREKKVEEDEINKYELNYGAPEVTGDVVEDIEPNEDDAGDTDTEEGRSEDGEPSIPKDEHTLDTAEKRLLNNLREMVSELSEKTDELSRKFEETDRRLSSLSSRLEILENQGQNYEIIQEKLKELSAIYDLISADVNPFMEDDLSGTSLAMDVDETPLDYESETENEEDDESDDINASENINNQYNMKAMIDWIDFLQSKTNGNIKDALDYYQKLGWISEGLKENIFTYIQGIKLENKYNAKDDKIITEDGDVEEEEGDWRLSPQEHKESLQYIKDIKNGGDIEKKQSIDGNGGQNGRWQRGEG